MARPDTGRAIIPALHSIEMLWQDTEARSKIYKFTKVKDVTAQPQTTFDLHQYAQIDPSRIVLGHGSCSTGRYVFFNMSQPGERSDSVVVGRDGGFRLCAALSYAC